MLTLYVGHDSLIFEICGTWLVHMWDVWDMTPSYVSCMGHDSLICEMCGTWLIDMWDVWDMTHWYVRCVGHDVFICEMCGTWLIHMGHHLTYDHLITSQRTHMTESWLIHLLTWHDSFIWSPHMCEVVTHSYVTCRVFLNVTWLLHMCDMTPSYVCRDSVACVTCLLHMCDVTHF